MILGNNIPARVRPGFLTTWGCADQRNLVSLDFGLLLSTQGFEQGGLCGIALVTVTLTSVVS